MLTYLATLLACNPPQAYGAGDEALWRMYERRPAFRTRTARRPRPDDERAAVLANPGFGKVFTDHMVIDRLGARARAGTTRRSGRAAADARSGLRGAALRAGDLRGAEGLSARRRRRRAVPPRGERPPLQRLGRAAGDARAARGDVRRIGAASWSSPTATGSRQIEGGSLYLRPVHVRDRDVPRRAPSAEYKFLVIASPGRRLFQGRRAGGVDLGLARTTPAPRPAAPARPSAAATTPPAWSPQAEAIARGLRPGRVPRRRRAPLGRGTGRHERVLRVRRRLDRHPAARRHDPARHHPRSPARRSRATKGSRCARSATRSTSGAPTPQSGRLRRGLRLRHRGGGHADRPRRGARRRVHHRQSADPAS